MQTIHRQSRGRTSICECSAQCHVRHSKTGQVVVSHGCHTACGAAFKILCPCFSVKAQRHSGWYKTKCL